MHDQRGKTKRSLDDHVRRRERRVDGAVGEVALVHLALLDVERLVLDVDQVGRVLGDVARLGDDDGDRLAHEARDAVGGGVVGRAAA